MLTETEQAVFEKALRVYRAEDTFEGITPEERKIIDNLCEWGYIAPLGASNYTYDVFFYNPPGTLYKRQADMSLLRGGLPTDSDLLDCLRYLKGPQSFKPENIYAVIAAWQGKADDDPWRWIVSLKGGKFAFVVANKSADGWDKSSQAFFALAPTAEMACRLCLGDLAYGDAAPKGSEIAEVIEGAYAGNNEVVYKALLEQVQASNLPKGDEPLGEVKL